MFGGSVRPPSAREWSELDIPEHLRETNLREGPPSARALERPFGRSATAAPSITLYRDHAAWCPYCQKTWMLLEEKRVPYRIEKINMACYGDKPRSFFDAQPSGTLPAAEIDGSVLRSSDAIILAILDAPGDASLDARQHPRCSFLLDLERQHFSAWLRWLGGGEGDKSYFVQVLDAVEAAIEGPYFLGDFTFVDCMYAPFLERMAASLAYFKGWVARGARETTGDPDLDAWQRYPKLNAWFDAMETRPAYRATMSDWYTHAHDLPPQLGGCVSSRTAGAVEVRSDVDSWTSEAPRFEPLWPWVDDARKEAAARLVANGPNVAKFAARGASAPGFPPFRAELADPNARPNDRLLPAVDAFLRLVAENLLVRQHPGGDDGYATAVSSLTTSDARDLGKCVAYLRDRVGVPRDMSFPAARALRLECNALIDALHGVH
ncbi:hypothetical protein CTAYLR_006273 [Chrysophaeum taylorii]|uniref:Glutathione S-transferase n=1 Tax=Chrysophaeum taylorii TaxID=2483200 RepID=A0AAD7ULG2_9STRA|nr:hypothetical protein CTAYLR_006273 [Chrysophaeum taylorii]